ncbi:leucine rich adaptor protein 1-like [Brachyistius frenatus]|uniref:leucine rich adaptor protein 1-like n=1 Tax=Brachyistius frenatus TaxID=100188 RepID=UPI0037E97F2A
MHGGMAEEILNDSLPDLKELESKIGRKTPESLLMWMKDAANCEDSWSSDVVDTGDHSSALRDSFSDKINNLKQEMVWLRSADVRILRQLVAVHEGIEAMRWLIEERGALASRGSSLTGSLSSLVTLEDHGPSMSPCRESPSPTSLQDFTETTGDESADQQSPHTDCGDSDHKSFSDMQRSESSEERPPSPSSPKFVFSRSRQGSCGQASFSPAKHLVSTSVAKSQPQHSDAATLKDIKGRANTIKAALLRSNRARGELKVGSFAVTQQSGETHTMHRTQESFKSRMEEEESESSGEKVLLGYDAQWRWVESQDDVTFL